MFSVYFLVVILNALAKEFEFPKTESLCMAVFPCIWKSELLILQEKKMAKEIIWEQLYVLLQLEVGFTHSTTHK